MPYCRFSLGDGQVGRDYDPARERLLVGEGYVERVPPAVWQYEVSFYLNFPVDLFLVAVTFSGRGGQSPFPVSP